MKRKSQVRTVSTGVIMYRTEFSLTENRSHCFCPESEFLVGRADGQNEVNWAVDFLLIDRQEKVVRMMLVDDSFKIIDKVILTVSNANSTFSGTFKAKLAVGDYKVVFAGCEFDRIVTVDDFRYKKLSTEHNQGIRCNLKIIADGTETPMPKVLDARVKASVGNIGTIYLDLVFENEQQSELHYYYAYCYDGMGKVVARYDDDDEFRLLESDVKLYVSDEKGQVSIPLLPKRILSPGLYKIVLYHNCVPSAVVEFLVTEKVADEENISKYVPSRLILLANELTDALYVPQVSASSKNAVLDKYLWIMAEYFSEWSCFSGVSDRYLNSMYMNEDKRPCLTWHAADKAYFLLLNSYGNGTLPSEEDFHEKMKMLANWAERSITAEITGLELPDEVTEEMIFESFFHAALVDKGAK